MSIVATVLPKGWEMKKLGEVLVKTETVDPTKKPNEEFTYLDVSSVNKETKEIEGATIMLGKDAPSRAKKLVRTNDVIFATVRPTHSRVAIITDEYDGQICSTGYFVLRGKEHIENKYLFYFLLTDEFNQQMEKLQKGASYPAVTDAEVKNVFLRYPKSLPEQQRLVALLDRCFAAIDRAKVLAEQNLQNARALFESYLQGVFESENWDFVKLSELATDISDGDHMPPPKSENGLPFITISNIDKRTHKIDFSDTFKVPQKYYDDLKPNKKPIKGDVLYTVTGSYGIPVLIEDDVEFCFQRHIGLIRPSKRLHSKLLYYWILSPQAISQANETATGTAQKTVSLKSLRNFSFPNIPLNEQQTIVRQLDALRAETQKLEAVYQKKIADLEELKKSVLEKAFRGELGGV